MRKVADKKKKDEEDACGAMDINNMLGQAIA